MMNKLRTLLGSEGNVNLYKGLGLTFGILILLVIVYNALTFRVYETEQAVITRFGEVQKIIVGDNAKAIEKAVVENQKLKDVKVVEGKGIRFKVPFVDQVEYFTDRYLTYDTNSREVITKDKKKVVLDNYVQWHIDNAALFKVTMKNERNAQLRIEDLVYSNINKEIGKITATDIISNKTEGEKMLQSVMEDVNKDLASYGMKVSDVRIKRTELPAENYENIYRRMQTERQSQAKKYRSEGQEEAQKIRSEAEKQATIIEAEAYEKAEKIKGEGDSEALRIYADAYGTDPEFYQFYQTLETYKKTLDGQTKIMIPQDSEFAKYLFGE